MERLQVIGLSGQAGSGKDWIGQNILQPMGFVPFSLAWHFKVWLVGKGEATHEEVFHTKPPEIRKKLQLEGTEYGRDIYGQDVWCDTLKEWLLVLYEHMHLSKFYIPDVRFINEVELVHNLNGKVFRIEAPYRVARNGLSEEARNHRSETELINFEGFDGFIKNDPDYAYTVEAQIKYLLNGYKE